MSAMRREHRPVEVHYPDSDGQPMAETDLHWQATVDLALMLKARYRDRDDVYVASNNFVYYREGDPTSVFSPDVYVVFGVSPKLRRMYKMWEEGAPPSVVFEITSRSTSLEDEGNKKVLCARLGVREYWMFDPEGEALSPALQGYRSTEATPGRTFEPITSEPMIGPGVSDVERSRRLRSEALGLILTDESGTLVLRDAESGERLLRPDELQAEVERLRGRGR